MVETTGVKATEAGRTARRAGIVVRAGIAGTAGTVAMVGGTVAMEGIVTVVTAGSVIIAMGEMTIIEGTSEVMIEVETVDMDRGATIVVVGPANRATTDGQAPTDTGTIVGTMTGDEVMIVEAVAMVGTIGMVPTDERMGTVRTTDRTDGQGTICGMGTGHVRITDVTNATNGRTNSGQQI